MATDTTGLRDGVVEWSRQVHDQAIEEFSRTLYDAAPVDTGELRASLEQEGGVDTGAEIIGAVGFTAEHASWQDEGTDPHEIVGNPLLAFEIDGHVVIVHSVQHPGSHKNDGWWSNNATDEGWGAACEAAAANIQVEV